MIPFQITPPGPVPDFRFLSSASVLASHYSASVSSVPLFLLPPHSGFHNASVLPYGFPVFHLIFRLVSRASFPVSGTWLSVCFFSSLPVSLPQLFHRCFPSIRFLSSTSFPGFSACFPLSFVPFSLLLTTQPSALSFPFFPFSPGSGSFGAYLSAFRSACFHASLSALVLSFLQFPSTFSCFASQWLPSVVILPISLQDSSP